MSVVADESVDSGIIKRLRQKHNIRWCGFIIRTPQKLTYCNMENIHTTFNKIRDRKVKEMTKTTILHFNYLCKARKNNERKANENIGHYT